MNYNIVFLMIALFFFVGCNLAPKSGEENEFSTIDVRECLQNPKKPIPMSEIYDKVKYIPLETTGDALLHGVNKVLMHNQFIFVSDNRFVYQFDKSGKFIRKIGGAGSGPGEYTGMIRFTLDPVNKEVLVYSTRTHILNVYNLFDGQFLYKHEIPYFLSDLTHLDKDFRVFFTREFNKLFDGFTIAEAYLINNALEIEDSVNNFLRNDIEHYSMGYVSLFPDNEGINYIYNFRDTLYHINHHFQRTPRAWFKFGNNESLNTMEISPGPGQIQYPDYLWVSALSGNSDHYYVTVRYGFAGGQVDNSSFVLYCRDERTPNHISALENDIDHGMPFWPRWIHKDNLISFYHAHEILSFVEKAEHGNRKGVFWQIAGNLSENDNPVLVIVK